MQQNQIRRLFAPMHFSTLPTMSPALPKMQFDSKNPVGSSAVLCQQWLMYLWAAGLKHKCVQLKLVILNSNWQWLHWHHLRNLIRLSWSHRLYNFVLFPHFRAPQNNLKHPLTVKSVELLFKSFEIYIYSLVGKHGCTSVWMTGWQIGRQMDRAMIRMFLLSSSGE